MIILNNFLTQKLNNMKLNELHQAIIELVEKYGYSKYDTSLSCGYFGHSNEPYYTSSVWVNKDRKFIESNHHNNPNAMLEALEENIKHYQKTYSKEIENIEIENTEDKLKNVNPTIGNTVLPAVSMQYRPTSSQLKKVVEETEFEPEEFIQLQQY